LRSAARLRPRGAAAASAGSARGAGRRTAGDPAPAGRLAGGCRLQNKGPAAAGRRRGPRRGALRADAGDRPADPPRPASGGTLAGRRGRGGAGGARPGARHRPAPPTQGGLPMTGHLLTEPRLADPDGLYETLLGAYREL